MKDKTKKRLKTGLAVLFKIVEVPLVIALVVGTFVGLCFGIIWLIEHSIIIAIAIGLKIICCLVGAFIIIGFLLMIGSILWEPNYRLASKIIEKLFKKGDK